jgi:prepilin-type N-terminal cleavage/methylation domain-containing protein
MVLHNSNRRGFTLVEMMVVIGIIALLLGVVLLIGSGALEDAKVKDTRVMLEQLQAAIDSYKQESPHRAINAATHRFGLAPPDDLMSYTPDPTYGTGNSGPQLPNLMQGGIGQYVNDSIGNGFNDDLMGGDYVPYGDIKALVFALRSRPDSRAIYDSIPERFRRTASNNEYFDLNDSGDFDQLIDQEVQYLVDGWDRPLEYFSVKTLGDSEAPTSHGWVSDALVTANRDQEVIMSYGPNGDTQDRQSPLQVEAIAKVTALGGSAAPGEVVFTNPLQTDNIYSAPGLGERVPEIQND